MPKIFQISLSNGGVPKLPFHRAKITADGVIGDRQNDMRRHGGKDRALCLYSLELIMKLQDEGHPIFPGSTGENLTISGLDWDRMQPGVQLRIGPAVKIELTTFTPPCGKIKGSFIDGETSRISEKENPGSARLYAKVLEPGTVHIGDGVELTDHSQDG